MTPFPINPAAYIKYAPNSPLSEFLRPMVTKYHIVRQVRFPSYSVYYDGEYVSVLRKNS